MIQHSTGKVLIGLTVVCLCGCGGAAPTGSSPPVSIAAKKLEIREGGSDSADDSIAPGGPIVVTGTIKSQTRPNRTVMVSVVAVDSQGRQMVHDSAGGTWIETDTGDTWDYEGSITAPSRPGHYKVVVRYGKEVLDEQDVNIADTARPNSD